MSSEKEIKDFEFLQRTLRTERDELRSQIQAIRNLLRRYRLTRGSRLVRTLRPRRSRITGFMGECGMDTHHREPPHIFPVQAMLTGHGPLNAEDTLREIRDVLRR